MSRITCHHIDTLSLNPSNVYNVQYSSQHSNLTLQNSVWNPCHSPVINGIVYRKSRHTLKFKNSSYSLRSSSLTYARLQCWQCTQYVMSWFTLLRRGPCHCGTTYWNTDCAGRFELHGDLAYFPCRWTIPRPSLSLMTGCQPINHHWRRFCSNCKKFWKNSESILDGIMLIRCFCLP